ncbi:MAG TPA: DUF5996 family protein [Streptosporangiaceae bacterium]|jgi:hypothetical protein|nr:DUF5996 family protein [Streptosporangiaceae bacterium]
MTSAWPAVSYDRWAATADTLHAHTQVLGKLAVELAPPGPELRHGALRLTARGWETAPLPAPDGSGSLVVALDLHSHRAVVEHSDGQAESVPLTPDRPVADVANEVLAAVARLGGHVRINPVPQEVPWGVPLDEDHEHASYDPAQVRDYFAAATQAALALAEFGAPYRGRSTPVNAWWGSFDLCVTLFSGAPADPPGDGFITRNSSDAEQIVVGWWPGDAGHPNAAFYAFAFPPPAGLADATLSPAAAGWDEDLGEFILDWDDVRAAENPRAAAVEFAHSAFRQAALAGSWSADLLGSTEGSPPPVR